MITKNTLLAQISYLNIRHELVLRLTPQHAPVAKAEQDYFKCASCGHERREHKIVREGGRGASWGRVCGCGCKHWCVDLKLHAAKPRRQSWVVWSRHVTHGERCAARVYESATCSCRLEDVTLLTDANTTEVWYFLSGMTRALDVAHPNGARKFVGSINSKGEIK